MSVIAPRAIIAVPTIERTTSGVKTRARSRDMRRRGVPLAPASRGRASR